MNAHPIHAIFMILRQRETPVILHGCNTVLIGVYKVSILFLYGCYKFFGGIFMKIRLYYKDPFKGASS